MEFQQGGTTRDSSLYMNGPKCYLMRGIGIYVENSFDEVNEYSQLMGAIIGGIRYGTVVSVGRADQISDIYSLLPNYPNPFNPRTTITYQIPMAGNVKLMVYDIMGREVVILVDELQQKGLHSIDWNAKDRASGTYFYKLQIGSFVSVKRMTLLK